MKFKLDENFGTRTPRIFQELGHHADTVIDEELGGASDKVLYDVCREQGLCLVTLDLDFSDVVSFPPQATGGIVVLRCPRNPSLTTLGRMVRQFLMMIGKSSAESLGLAIGKEAYAVVKASSVMVAVE